MLLVSWGRLVQAHGFSSHLDANHSQISISIQTCLLSTRPYSQLPMGCLHLTVSVGTGLNPKANLTFHSPPPIVPVNGHHCPSGTQAENLEAVLPPPK